MPRGRNTCCTIISWLVSHPFLVASVGQSVSLSANCFQLNLRRAHAHRMCAHKCSFHTFLLPSGFTRSFVRRLGTDTVTVVDCRPLIANQ
uniref:Putative secreted protein n=1 Tax=Anopheles darlingi TaxID=43151 RepID=A0A2M4D8C2_ANODA